MFNLGHLTPASAQIYDEDFDRNARMFGVNEVSNDKTAIELRPGKPLGPQGLESNFDTVLMARFYYYKSLGLSDAEAARRATFDSQMLSIMDTVLMTGDRANGGNILYDEDSKDMTVVDFGYIFYGLINDRNIDNLVDMQYPLGASRVAGWDLDDMLPEVREVLTSISAGDILRIVDSAIDEVDWDGLVERHGDYVGFVPEAYDNIEHAVDEVIDALLGEEQ